MKIKLSAVFFAFLLCFSGLPRAEASVPKLLTYHGVLTNSSGSYLSGTYDMTFKLYGASTGGTALWTESHTSVSIASGQFSVQLGSVTTLNLDFSADYWLGITVGADSEMTPRVQLTSVGYAYMAEKVVNGFDQTAHDALDHKNVAGVKDNTVHIAKTNFKLDAYSTTSANNLGTLIVDTFTDASGIDSSNSSDYSWRGSTNYDVVANANSTIEVSNTGTDTQVNETYRSSAAAEQGVAEQFTVGSTGYNVNKVSIYLYRVGARSGENYRVAVYTDSSGSPGTEVVGADFSFDSLPTGSAAWVDYSLTSTALSANTSYWVVLLKGSGSSDGSNWIVTRVTESDQYTGGTMSRKSGGSWSAGPSPWDMPFKVWSAGSATATVQSVAFSRPSAAEDAMIIAEETLGTGSIAYSVSRDNGTTWTSVTKDTVTDISSQPSGTQMKWKAVITGDAELDAIALAT